MHKIFNILTFSVHEGWETSLCKTGHNFYSICSPERPNGWKKEERPIPENYVQINKDKVNEMLENGEFDLFLYHTPFEQRQIATVVSKKFNLPIVEMNHCLPLKNWHKNTIVRLYSENKANVVVFTTKHQAIEWGYNPIGCRICGHTVDDKFYANEYSGELRNIISVAYDFLGRKEVLGYDDWKIASDKFPVLHFGDERIGEIATAQQMRENNYIKNRCFLNTAYRSTLPTSMLEAMACGMPVVSCANGVNEYIFTNMENGLIYTDVFEMLGELDFLLKNKKEAEKIGENGYNLFREHFSTDKFVSNWNNIFLEAIN